MYNKTQQEGASHPVGADSQVDAHVGSEEQLPDVAVALLGHLLGPDHVALQARVLLQDREVGRSPGERQDRVLRRREPEGRAGLPGSGAPPAALLICSHSPPHPLSLVVGAEIKAPKQDRLVKVHLHVVPERTEGVAILGMVETSWNGRRTDSWRGFTHGGTHLHGAALLVSASLCGSLKAVGPPPARGPVLGGQRPHEVLQADHAVVRPQGLQLEELAVGDVHLRAGKESGVSNQHTPVPLVRT